jgi:hypothetical protein
MDNPLQAQRSSGERETITLSELHSSSTENELTMDNEKPRRGFISIETKGARKDFPFPSFLIFNFSFLISFRNY